MVSHFNKRRIKIFVPVQLFQWLHVLIHFRNCENILPGFSPICAIEFLPNVRLCLQGFIPLIWHQSAFPTSSKQAKMDCQISHHCCPLTAVIWPRSKRRENLLWFLCCSEIAEPQVLMKVYLTCTTSAAALQVSTCLTWKALKLTVLDNFPNQP